MIFVVAAVGVLAALGLVWMVERPMLPTRTAGKLESLPRNTQAMELYLEGRRIARQRLSPNLNRASELFQQAVEKDPNFALAYAALAEMHAIKVANSLASPDSLRAGEAAAKKALTLNPTLPDAHASLGLLKYARWDWEGAEREYAVALRLDPTNARALMRSAMVSFVMGRFSEAESRLHRAQLLDPSNGAITGMLCELYYYWRRYDDCIRQADRILQFDPANVAFAWFRKTLVLIENRRFAEAAIAARNYARSVPAGDANSQVLAIWIETRGERSAFAPRYQEILNAHSRDHLSPYGLALTYAGIGDTENAFQNLELAYQQRVTDLVSLKWEPMFDSIRSDPRYANLIARMGLSLESGIK